AAAGFPTADVATPFETDNFALTGSYLGQTEPQNVANICNWTHMCEAGDIHANNTGHAVLAQAFETLIDGTPFAPTAVTAVPGNASASVHWTASSANGSPITGYVVTPYVGSVAGTPRVFNT